MTKVLIVGRPNVGKSSLFNRLVRQRRSLVLDQPGVTRDIITGEAEWWGHSFEVWDSGGLMWNTSSIIFSAVQDHVQSACDKADLIIFVMDAHLGLHDEDKKIFKWIKDKKHLLVVNKVDHPQSFKSQLSEFYTLGSDFIQTSFEKDENIALIVDWIIENSKNSKFKKIEKISLLMTGQCNVGKSSLCNLILKKNRMVTSSEMHTTVDVVDEVFQYHGKKYEILDTAGIRRKSKRLEDLEKISSAKSLSYFEKSDLILLVMDGQKKFSRQDARLFTYCMEKHKTTILVINKWDISQVTKIEMRKTIRQQLRYFPDIPCVFISAKTGEGLGILMKTISECVKKNSVRISTSALNKFFIEVVQQAPAPVYGTRNVKFYYLTQTKKTPPSFIIFTNEPKGVNSSYQKFLIKKIQEKYSLKGIPIQTTFLKKS
ncbi:MAG: ribosome biogenesis GTPase Der [Bdellovibrionales bacterium]|nr:ribosome biogenesis GTPase Der [Bdellovibrionales bacterium]